MRLATIKLENPSSPFEARDGQLVVVHPEGRTAALSPREQYPSLISAVQDWTNAENVLRSIEEELIAGTFSNTIELNSAELISPLPRTYAFLDGSAFIQHIILVRKARGAEPPEDLFNIPLMYQGLSDPLLGPTEDIPLVDFAHGMDFEAEVAVILDDVPMGTKAADAEQYIKLFVLLNDVSLRNLIPRELKTGFGFFHGKPPTALSPFVATVEELGDSWRDGRVHLNLDSELNGEFFGKPNAGEMHFSFFELIEHAAKTRPLTAGTILGSGTVSNKDESVGSSCLAEKRMLEKINNGEISTPFMNVGDHVKIEMKKDGRNIFGTIAQKVVSAQ